MGGGLMQLVAYGAQDVYLTGNPQITFFKVVYRRHTNFSMEAIEQTLNGTIALGNKVSCTISRNGDLVHRVYLQVDLVGSSSDSGTGGARVWQAPHAPLRRTTHRPPHRRMAPCLERAHSGRREERRL